MSKPRRRLDVVITDLGSEHVLLDPTTEVAHTVTPQAAVIFSACDGSASASDIAESLGLASGDVETALAELQDAGLLASSGVSRRAVLAGAGVAGAAVLGSVVLPASRAAASGGNPTPTGPQSYNLFAVASQYGATQDGPFFFRYGLTAPGVGSSATKLGPVVVNGATLNGFQGSDPNGTNFPQFYAVTGSDYNNGTVTAPKDSFVVHPGPSQSAIIKFVTPSAGTVKFTGAVSRDDIQGGNGTVTSVVDSLNNPPNEGLFLVTDDTTGTAPQGFTATFPGAAPGAAFYVIIGNNGDYSFDSTNVDLTVTVTP